MADDLDGDGVIDEAGFSILILDQFSVGIAVSFWEDRIFSTAGQFLDPVVFAQAEVALQLPSEMATMRSYELTIMRGAYRLVVNGVPLLEGPTRSYDVFNAFLDPFDKPNIINIGDASDSAAARARIGAISIEPCYQRRGPLLIDLTPTASGARLAWESVPGATYQVESGTTLEDWSEVATLTAASFSTHYDDSLLTSSPTRFFRITETLP